MKIVRSASARYEGLGKDGIGHLTTQSGVLDNQPYSFGTRFGDVPGTNPEELIAAAHAGCFTMALSFALAGAGYEAGVLETTAKITLEKDGDGFTVTRSDLTLNGEVKGLTEAQFLEFAHGAEKNCPVSKVLNAEITLNATFSG